jgi:Helix-turn-helix domain
VGLDFDESEVELVARLIESAVRTGRQRDGSAAPSMQLAMLAARVAEAVPGIAATLPVLREVASASLRRSVAVSGSRIDVQPSGQPDSWLRPEQAARLAGVTPRAIRAACAEGRLPGRKSPAGGWLVRRSSVEEWRRKRAA